MSFDDMKGILNVYFKGDMEAAPALAGQSAGLIDAVKSAKDIIDETVAEFFQISARMGAMSQRQSFY
jgi:enoyl-[acyl-carrier protein] reductase II